MVGRALRSLERYEEALAIQLELEDDWKATGSEDGFVYEELGELLVELGDDERASRYFGKALPLLSKLSWVEESRIARIAELAGAERE